ncbi:hypothetical protein QTP88_028370 [Uroleucon formosanum]
MGHINNIETSFILDSGATISVINSEQVINSSNSLIETKNIRVHTANGSILKVIGKMEIDIAFKSLIFPTQFVLVSNLAGPALLGTDFLSKYRVQLDFFNKEIFIYKNITNKITFTFKPKRDVLSSCTIVEDSVKQNKQSKETHENKIEINIDNNSENDVNLSGQNENIILLEKLAKQVNDTDKKFPPFHKIKPKINKLEINNVTLYETKKYIESDKINDTYELLNKSIISLASKFVKLENVPSDGEVDTEPIEIKLSDKTPVNLRNFKLSLSEIKEIEKQTKDLLEAGIIEHSISAYSSPIFLVPKGQPQGNKYFSCLDAMSGFHQLKLNDNSKEITSFSTSTGHYQFTRLPFGLTNAPQNFQKVMNKIMAGLTYRINCCYLDDCVCFGKTFEEHLNALEITFERLLKYKLKLKISKCKFGYTEKLAEMRTPNQQQHSYSTYYYFTEQ